MTRTHPNQSLDSLISLIILSGIWQFAAFPYISAIQKAVKLCYKNLSFQSAHLIPNESTSALNSTNLFLFSRHHIPSNSIAPFSSYKHTQNPQFLQSLWRGANTQNVSAVTLYGSQCTLSTKLITLNLPDTQSAGQPVSQSVYCSARKTANQSA